MTAERRGDSIDTNSVWEECRHSHKVSPPLPGKYSRRKGLWAHGLRDPFTTMVLSLLQILPSYQKGMHTLGGGGNLRLSSYHTSWLCHDPCVNILGNLLWMENWYSSSQGDQRDIQLCSLFLSASNLTRAYFLAFVVVYLGGTLCGAQGLLLFLCSGVTPDSAQGDHMRSEGWWQTL